MLPISLNLNGIRVLVVGGGAVGRRKARMARAAGAAVRVVASEPPPDGWADGEWCQGTYDETRLDGAALVFAAGPPELNERVAREARARGIWVNSATDPAAGDFTLPAVARRGVLTIAVDTGGAAPALSRRLRVKLEAEYDDAFATWVRLLGAIRETARERVPDAERRRTLLDGFADWPWLERLRRDGEAATWKQMLAALG